MATARHAKLSTLRDVAEVTAGSSESHRGAHSSHSSPGDRWAAGLQPESHATHQKWRIAPRGSFRLGAVTAVVVFIIIIIIIITIIIICGVLGAHT